MNSNIIWKSSTAKMVPLINENEEKYSCKENGQKEIFMFRIMLLWKSKMWKYIVTKINSQHYPFVVHIPNLMTQGGRVIIIICVLIKNLVQIKPIQSSERSLQWKQGLLGLLFKFSKQSHLQSPFWLFRNSLVRFWIFYL